MGTAAQSRNGASGKAQPKSGLGKQKLGFDVPEAGRRYEICDELGRGGNATVYLALDRDLARQVAVKVLRRELCKSREAVSGFLNEAQITAKLQHPGIVPIHEIGVLDGNDLFFAMERVQGDTLHDVLEQRASGAARHRLHDLLRIFEQVCQTVAYAHSRRVIHRDLKPQNIMVGDFNKVYVMDWGIAEDLEQHRPDLPLRHQTPNQALAQTLTDDAGCRNVKGTANYMSPEQVLGMSNRIDYRSDVFSLGVILYEIVAARHPFRGPDRRDTLNAIKHHHPPALKPPFGLQALSSICRKALAKMPEERYADAGQLAEDLRRALEHRTVSAHRDNLASHSFRFARRNLALTILVTAALAVAGGFALYSYREQQDVARLLAAADDHRRSADHYDERIRILEHEIETSRRALVREMRLLTADLRARRHANLGAIRSLLTAALVRRPQALAPEQLGQLKQLWLDELEAELRQGNREGARRLRGELDALSHTVMMQWTPDQERRLVEIEGLLE